MRSRLAASAVFALAVLALSGCGSGKVETHTESDSTPTTTAPTISGGTTSTTQPTTTRSGGPSTSNEVDVGPAFNQKDVPFDFGLVKVGSSRALEFTIKNVGRIARTIDGITIGGEQASEFVVTGGDCAVGTKLAASATCTLEITFSPMASGTRNGSFAISVNPCCPGGWRLRGGLVRKIQPPGPGIVTTQPIKTG
jgi:hypothetical protein